MATAIWAYKTFNRSEVPALVWVGDNVDAGLKALAADADKYVRAERQQIIGGTFLPVPETESKKTARLAKEAAEREAAAKAKATEAAKIANAALEKAKKEAAEAEAALAALSKDPENPALKAAAEKEKLESEAAFNALKNRRK